MGTTQQDIDGYLERGLLVKGCPQCERSLEAWRETGRLPIAPWHRAMSSCRSGGRAHCTCDTCF